MKNYSLRENSYKQMYLINKFEKDILEKSLNKMNTEQSNSSHIVNSSEQSQSDAIVTEKPGDITLKKNNDKEKSNDSSEISVLKENQQPLNIFDNSQPIQQPSLNKQKDVSSKRPKKSYTSQNVSPPGVKTRQMKHKLLKLKHGTDNAIISQSDDASKRIVKGKKHKPVEDEDMSFRGWKL